MTRVAPTPLSRGGEEVGGQEDVRPTSGKGGRGGGGVPGARGEGRGEIFLLQLSCGALTYPAGLTIEIYAWTAALCQKSTHSICTLKLVCHDFTADRLVGMLERCYLTLRPLRRDV